jgi:UDP-N-acetylglucosamine acyltransferase
MAIDPTARVADGARIGDGVEVGPYCVIGPNVELHANARLISHVNVTGVTSVGEGTVVYPFASLGTPPQSVHYRGGATRLLIGARCQIREHVTMNTGTENGGGITRVGERCFFMVSSHIAHDCEVGDNVTFANCVTLGGHVTIGANAFVGGLVGVHQRGRIGEGAMIGGLAPVRADVIPFGLALNDKLDGLNTVGLLRRGVTRTELHELRRAYRMLFVGEGVFADRVDAVAAEFAGHVQVAKIVAFIREGQKRPLMHPRLDGGEEPGDDAA